MADARAPLLAQEGSESEGLVWDAGVEPMSWRQRLLQLLSGELQDAELWEASWQALKRALPETVCVLRLPGTGSGAAGGCSDGSQPPRAPAAAGAAADRVADGSSTEQQPADGAEPATRSAGATWWPPLDAAAMLQEKLVCSRPAAGGPEYVPACHRAVELVQLAGACGVALRRSAAARALWQKDGPDGGLAARDPTTPLSTGKGRAPTAAVPPEQEPALPDPHQRRDPAVAARVEQNVAALLCAVMQLAQAQLQQEPGGAVWSGSPDLRGGDALAAVRAWAAAARPAPSELVHTLLQWAPRGLQCVPDPAVAPQEWPAIVALASLRRAVAGGRSETAWVSKLHALREHLQLAALPLRWRLDCDSAWHLRPARTVLHAVWEAGAGSGRVHSACRVVRVLSTFRGRPGQDGSMAQLLAHILTRPGVESWLQGTPFRLPEAPKWAMLDFGGDAAAAGQELYPGMRLLAVEGGSALLLIDVHWEVQAVVERRSWLPRGVCTVQ